MSFDQLRFTANSGNSPISGALLRSLHERGELSIPALRSLSPLSDKAQVMVDKAVGQVGLERLTIVADVLAAGLTMPLSDPLSVTQVEWQVAGRAGYAQRVMNPSARGENQMPDTTTARLPVYLTVDDFNIGIRTLRMSQRVGQPLDTAQIQNATRNVNEAIEDAMINGATTLDGQALKVGGYGQPGLLTATGVNTGNFTAASWDATPDGAGVVGEIINAIGVLQSKQRYGPYNVYLPTAVGNYFMGDFSATKGDLTIMERLGRITAGGRPIQVKVADKLPATKVVIVQMTSDVVDIIDGQRPTVIPWTSVDGFTLYWLVMAIMIPRVRPDYNGASGIFVGTIT